MFIPDPDFSVYPGSGSLGSQKHWIPDPQHRIGNSCLVADIPAGIPCAVDLNGAMEEKGETDACYQSIIGTDTDGMYRVPRKQLSDF
jgi:hypothetical protein